MKQIFQNVGTGEIALAEVPSPGAKSGRVLIRTLATLISTGTERMLLDFGRLNLIEIARQRPDKVR